MRLVDHKARIYTPPRPPRLGLDMPRYRWRTLGWLLLACAVVSGIIGYML